VTDRYADAPSPSYRLIPSQFPPIGLFDTVATPSDLEAVMDLAGWTNDRLVAERIARLPKSEWVYGRSNSSVVMAAFLHTPPSGLRFNRAELGAWYAAAALPTAVAEVAHHLRREAVARGVATARRRYRVYSAILAGSYLDIRGQQSSRPDLYASANYDAAQALGERVRASGGAGFVYDCLISAGGVNVAAHRPSNVTDVLQTDHYEISVQAGASRIDARRLAA
jgi:hypothetical protein